MMLPFTDFTALLGITVVVCAAVWQAQAYGFGAPSRRPWIILPTIALLLIPVGPALLPVAAYIRGISSDLSFMLVMLAVLKMRQLGGGSALITRREKAWLSGAVLVAALGLYPLALGWGAWDAYRLGWASMAMLLALLSLCGLAWYAHMRVLALMVAFCLLAWVAGWQESDNLWDYLLDPWLVGACLLNALRSAWRLVRPKAHIANTAPISVDKPV